MNNKPFTYEVSSDFDHVLEEKGNTYASFRKIKWGDSDTYKPDIRKYYATEEGERMAKGISLSDEGCNELTRVLLKEGYGNDKDIFNTIKSERPELMSRFIYDILINQDPETLNAHLDAYPVPEGEDDQDNYYDLEEVI